MIAHLRIPRYLDPSDSGQIWLKRYVAQWQILWNLVLTNMASQIQWLRGVIDTVSGEPDEDIVQLPNPSETNSADGGVRILGLGGLTDSIQNQQSFGPHLFAFGLEKTSVAQLCQVYLRQVDPIIKILHRPSLSGWLEHGESYLGYPEGHASTEALKSAVCYAAVNSMTERQCEEMYHRTKSDIVMEFRKACESTIERSGLLSTRDITVLQAFVLYLVSDRKLRCGFIIRGSTLIIPSSLGNPKIEVGLCQP